MFKKVILNTGAQITTKFITASTTFLITILITRSLGKTGYGQFTLIFAFVGYFYTLGDFGLNNIFIKLSGENHTNLFQSLFGLRLVLGFALALTAILVSQFLPYNPVTQIGFSPIIKIGILIASLTIITQTLLTTANAYFQLNLRYHLSTIAITIGSLLVLSFVAINSVLHPSLMAYVWAYVLGGAAFIITAFYLIAAKLKQNIIPLFNITEFKKLLTAAWPVGIALIFNLIYFRVDVFILGTFRSAGEVGIYGLAYQFFEAALTIPIFFSNSLYPILSNLEKKNHQAYQKQIKFWAMLLSLLGVGLTISLVVVSLFIPLIFGQSFVQSQASLQVLALGLPFFFISALLWHLVIINNRQKSLTIVYALGAAFNLIANLVFIPKFGYMAASVVTVISEILITLLLLIALKYKQIAKAIY